MSELVTGSTLRALVSSLPDPMKDVLANLIMMIVIGEDAEPAYLREWWDKSQRHFFEALSLHEADILLDN